MNEDTLINRLKDPKTRHGAFSALVEQYSQKLYWVIRHIVTTHEDADDALQNTFLKVWNKLDYFRGDANIGTWLHRIAVNEALDIIRKQKRRGDSDMDIDTTQPKVYADEYFDGDEADLLLREAMDTLPEAQRAVFSLKYYDDLPYKEISEILGTSEGGLKANYHHAVEKIKRFIEKRSI